MDNGRKELVFLKTLVHIFAINIMIFWFVCLFSFDLLIIMLFYSKQNNNKKEWNLCVQAELHYKENIVGCCFFI